jgi:hypothetical protein
MKRKKARTTQETNPNFQQFLKPAGQDCTEHNADSLKHTLKEQAVTINEKSSLDQCREALTSSSTQRPQDECDQNFEKKQAEPDRTSERHQEFLHNKNTIHIQE